MALARRQSKSGVALSLPTALQRLRLARVCRREYERRMDLLQSLQTHFGHEGFRDGQEAVIRALLADESALALFPTGAGKSLCYQLPAVLREGTALVI